MLNRSKEVAFILFYFTVWALWSQHKRLSMEIWFLLGLVLKLAPSTSCKGDPIFLLAPPPSSPVIFPAHTRSVLPTLSQSRTCCFISSPVLLAVQPGSKERAYSINHQNFVLAHSHCKSSGRLGKLCGFYLFMTSLADQATDFLVS